MFLLKGYETGCHDVIHVTHKYFETDEKKNAILETLQDFFLRAPFKPFSVKFDKVEMFGKDKDVRVLRPDSNGEFYIGLKEKLDALVPDKWPEYKPHISVSANVDSIDAELDRYVLVQGGKVLWQAPIAFDEASDADGLDKSACFASQVLPENTERALGGLPCSSLSKKSSDHKAPKSPSERDTPISSRNVTTSLVESDSKPMKGAWQTLESGWVSEPKTIKAGLSAYFRTRPGNDETLKRFLAWVDAPDLESAEPLDSQAANLKTGLVRVRLDDSDFRLILRVEFYSVGDTQSFVQFNEGAKFSYVEDKSYRKFLERVDKGEVSFFGDMNESADGSRDLVAIYKDAMKKYFPSYNVPAPNFKVVNRATATFLGQTRHIRSQPTTTILIQKSILDDEDTLRRVVAHEAIHHIDMLTNPRSSGHGGFFQKLSKQANEIEGREFINAVSDETYKTSATKKFYLFIMKNKDGRYVFAPSYRPASAVLEKMKPEIEAGEIAIVVSDDPRFSTVGAFRFGKEWFRGADKQEELGKLFDANKGKPFQKGALREEDEDDGEVVVTCGHDDFGMEESSCGLDEAVGDEERAHLAKLKAQDSFDVYRAISIDKPEVATRIRALGVFWTDEKDSAHVHWGETKPYQAIFRARVTPEQVNWEKTTEMRTNPRFAAEAEIRLKDNQKIEVVDVEIEKYLSRDEMWEPNKEEIRNRHTVKIGKTLSTGRTVMESEDGQMVEMDEAVSDVTLSPRQAQRLKGSKAVRNGKPIALYHGTNSADVKDLKPMAQGKAEYGKGIYFAENPVDASDNYASKKDDVNTNEVEDGIVPNVHIVFIATKNPANVELATHGKKVATALGVPWEKVMAVEIPDADEYGVPTRSGHGDGYKISPKNWYKRLADIMWEKHNGYRGQYALDDGVRKAGFDALYVPTNRWWIVFEASQVVPAFMQESSSPFRFGTHAISLLESSDLGFRAASQRRLFEACRDLHEDKLTVDQALKVLGLERTDLGDATKLKKAYRATAMDAHPDRGGSEEVMKKVNAAYELLQSGGMGAAGGSGTKRGWDQADWEAREEKYRGLAVKAIDYLKEKFDFDVFLAHFRKFDPAFEVSARYYPEKSVTRPDLAGVIAEFKTPDGKRRFTLDFSVRLMDMMSTGLGGDGATYPWIAVTSAYVDGKSQKLKQERYTFGSTEKALLDPDALFPSSRLKKFFSGEARKGSKFSKADMFSALVSEMNGRVSQDNVYLPLGDGDLALRVYRSVFLRQPIWMSFGVVEGKYGSKTIATHTKSFPESYETVELFKAAVAAFKAEKGSREEKIKALFAVLSKGVERDDSQAESVDESDEGEELEESFSAGNPLQFGVSRVPLTEGAAKEMRGSLWEMANALPEDTGLPVTIWISAKNAGHGPRIKASFDTRLDVSKAVSVTIEDEPRQIGSPKHPHFPALAAFVKANKDVLLA
ncbi:MAG: SprT-like domain-containing protein, partial [Luteolibacter sp.]